MAHTPVALDCGDYAQALLATGLCGETGLSVRYVQMVEFQQVELPVLDCILAAY